jgi:serpin B
MRATRSTMVLLAVFVAGCAGPAPSQTVPWASPSTRTPMASPSPAPSATPVPSPSPSSSPAPSSWPPPGSEIHVVVAGDTLWGIGQHHGVTVGKLLEANPQITDRSLLRPGDLVAIPPILTPGVALPDLAIADLARTPIDAAAAKEAAAWINAFGIDLYRAMLDDGSLDPKTGAVFSPTSIAMALAMARAGAKGETAAQIDDVLHARGGDALGRGLGGLDQVLASREGTWTTGGRTHTVALRLANGAFIQQDWAIESSFLDRIAADFGSGVWLVDYRKDPEAARRTINAWVNSKTRGRIPELLGTLDEPTMLVLVNAVYLKAEWEHWFWEAATKPEPFTRLDGTTVDVPTMHRTAGGGCASPPIAYAEGEGWRAVDLRTEAREDGAPLSMAVIVPDDLRAFESTLSAKRLKKIAATLDAERRTFEENWVPDGVCPYELGCYPYDVELHMPKFGVETRVTLASVLSSLGMPLAFDASRADFSGVHVPEGDADRFYVTSLIHQANVAIDERGIEAAAATAMGEGCAGPGPYETHTLKVDRPFLFTVRDVETGAILFMGRVVDPSAKK